MDKEEDEIDDDEDDNEGKVEEDWPEDMNKRGFEEEFDK
jgi:hypothetical protein